VCEWKREKKESVEQSHTHSTFQTKNNKLNWWWWWIERKSKKERE
jgi:hypothetical protein